jgi:alanyl-tRNA synthetase
MTTKRLYYEDAYATRFKARIVERVRVERGTAVATAIVLDKSYFYPTSGGQPFDKGVINDVPVLDVTIREADGAILHWISEGDIWSDDVVADIHWGRRFDHMQQHTGQHILSQAFIRVADAETVSFHLSEETVTIDLEATAMQPEHIEQAELLANQVIWQNRPILMRVVTPDEAEQLPLRKIPPGRDGKLRLIEIQDFDLTACGGTHVSATGEVGLIKIVKLGRVGTHLRVEFGCGQRALQDYRQKNSVVNRLTAVLTTGTTEIVDSVSRLQEELKEARRQIKRQQTSLIQLEAESLLAHGKKKNGTIIITRVYTDAESDPSQLRTLATRLTSEENVVAFLGLAGEKCMLIFGRSAAAPGEMNQLIKPALQMLGSASGGGTGELAQGGGPAADRERVEQAVARAERLLMGQL